MIRNSLRFIWVALLATLCASAAISVYAGDEEKIAVHYVGKHTVDLTVIGVDEGVVMEDFAQIRFEYPDKGTFEFQDTAGPWFGSYGRGDVVSLHFDTYKGALPFIPQGSPMVYMLGKMREGADFFDPTYPGLPPGLPFPEYQNFDGWYKFLALVDGGLGPKDDWVLGCVSPVPPNRYDEAKAVFEDIIQSGDLVCPGKVVIGNIRVPAGN